LVGSARPPSWPNANAIHRAAELLNAIPESSIDDEHLPPPTTHSDAEEALLEAKEQSKYLLAKSFFDCREYDRCAAVFLPENLLSGLGADAPNRDAPAVTRSAKGKGKASAGGRPGSKSGPTAAVASLPRISQKSLFLALYAKVISGEKKRDEEAGFIQGPQDVGTIVNKQLLVVGRYLDVWFEDRAAGDDEAVGSQGWLEYLYMTLPLPQLCPVY
jgi:anaphase-promoting complex subunit 8